MAVEITYERGGLGVHVYMSGAVDYEEMRRTFDSIWDRPESASLRYHILQADPELTLEIPVERYREVGRMLSEIEKRNPNVVTAFVPGRRVIWGLSELFLIYGRVWGNQPKYDVFQKIEDARDWIARQCPDLFNAGERSD